MTLLAGLSLATASHGRASDSPAVFAAGGLQNTVRPASEASQSSSGAVPVSRFVVPGRVQDSAAANATDHADSAGGRRGTAEDALRNPMQGTRGSGDVLSSMLRGTPAEAASSSARLTAPPISVANSPVRSRPGTAHLPDRHVGLSAASLRAATGAATSHRRLHSADARTWQGSHDARPTSDAASFRQAAAMGDADRAERVELHNAAGAALRKSGNFAGAVREYSAALALAPRHFKAIFNRGFAYDKASRQSIWRPPSQPPSCSSISRSVA